jgi:hypothetical protein
VYFVSLTSWVSVCLGSRGAELTPKELDQLIIQEIKSKARAKTAPEKIHRKNWHAASIDIKTYRGEKVKVKAPGL